MDACGCILFRILLVTTLKPREWPAVCIVHVYGVRSYDIPASLSSDRQPNPQCKTFLFSQNLVLYHSQLATIQKYTTWHAITMSWTIQFVPICLILCSQQGVIGFSNLYSPAKHPSFVSHSTLSKSSSLSSHGFDYKSQRFTDRYPSFLTFRGRSFCSSSLHSSLTNDDYQEVFRDDFDGPLNLDVWGFDIGRGPNNSGWGNGEQQYYTDSPSNAFTENGSLHVRIVKEDPSSEYPYTSARLVTRDTFSFAYGKVEARIRIKDHIDGPFAAVWALSLKKDDPNVNWPLCGEIDFFEYQSIWNYTPATLHFQDRHGGDALSFHGTENFLTKDWHLYTMEWTPDFISFSHDGEEIGRYNRPADSNVNNWPYTEDNPFYLILNNALHPEWGSAPDENFTEHTMEVDYISVSQKKTA